MLTLEEKVTQVRERTHLLQGREMREEERERREGSWRSLCCCRTKGK